MACAARPVAQIRKYAFIQSIGAAHQRRAIPELTAQIAGHVEKRSAHCHQGDVHALCFSENRSEVMNLG